MPHTPGHTNNNSYMIYGTDEPYSGLTVKIGGYMYTTVGGALEGHSVQLIDNNQQVMNNTGPIEPVPQPGDDTLAPLLGTSTEYTRSKAPRSGGTGGSRY
tara:strand:+ start:165 stop:464 length:300 start_codon:yes stop_codon:yes gene_type:complete